MLQLVEKTRIRGKHTEKSLHKSSGNDESSKKKMETEDCQTNTTLITPTDSNKMNLQ